MPSERLVGMFERSHQPASGHDRRISAAVCRFPGRRKIAQHLVRALSRDLCLGVAGGGDPAIRALSASLSDRVSRCSAIIAQCRSATGVRWCNIQAAESQ